MFFSLANTSSNSPFPDPELAESEPDGLLAIGGDLSVQRLLRAYCAGIFPWFSEGEPILWWSPDPRLILRPAKLHISRSLRKLLRRGDLHATFDRAFPEVMKRCATAPRHHQQGTWINTAMIDAYVELHRRGYAHSVEVWRGRQLVGGLYGVAIGSAFYGESMFSAQSNASKVALAALAKRLQRHQFRFIDCQMETPHLLSMGAELISRKEFLSINSSACSEPNDMQWRTHD
jgi:leucyl/phenylalanyl-tRNA---protein transferase